MLIQRLIRNGTLLLTVIVMVILALTTPSLTSQNATNVCGERCKRRRRCCRKCYATPRDATVAWTTRRHVITESNRHSCCWPQSRSALVLFLHGLPELSVVTLFEGGIIRLPCLWSFIPPSPLFCLLRGFFSSLIFVVVIFGNMLSLVRTLVLNNNPADKDHRLEIG